MNAGTATLTITPDLRGLQMLGDAARAVELANGQDCATVDDAYTTYHSAIQHWPTHTSGDERAALLNLAACCLARLHEIR